MTELNRADLFRLLAHMQEQPTFTGYDIQRMACSYFDDEVERFVWDCFRKLRTQAEKQSTLEVLRQIRKRMHPQLYRFEIRRHPDCAFIEIYELTNTGTQFKERCVSAYETSSKGATASARRTIKLLQTTGQDH